MKIIYSVLALLVVTSCGGGGGGGSSPAPLTPVPNINLSSSSTTVTTGEEFTLTWSSTNATSCSASGNWSGAKSISGNEKITETTAGSNTYTLTCSGDGGSLSKSVNVAITFPAPVINFTSSSTTVTTGEEFILTWSSTNATSCSASGNWSGAKSISGNENITETTAGSNTYTLTCSGDGGSASESISVTIATTTIDTWYGTKTPSFIANPPESYELFEASNNLTMAGALDGLDHEPTEANGAGKMVFVRVLRAFKHGLEYGEQFGFFGSWLASYGVNSIEGGLWVNPKTAGPYYYPTLHLAGVGDLYHACSDVQMGSGLYERIIGDKWLNMIQISNKLLTIPGSNIGFDMEQDPYTEDNGIWVGYGWSNLNLDHPREYKFWMSFVESYDYQGPLLGYIPEYFNWVDPEKINDGRYAAKLAEYGSNYGSFATKGMSPNYGNGNEQYIDGLLRFEDDIFYVPMPNLPIHKDKEYLIAHPQSISQSAMEDYSSALKNNTLENPLINSSNRRFNSATKSTHRQLKILDQVDGEEHRYFVEPSYDIGFENNLGHVQWDDSSRQDQIAQNGYAYVKKLDTKWQVEDGASDEYKNHPNQYNTELVSAPDTTIRAPSKTHEFFSYKERDTSNPEFENWDIGSRTRYETTLESGATVTYVWFKFIEQPAMLSAQQNHPETYTDEYLQTLQTHIEKLHTSINSNSTPNPSEPVFINYKGAENPDNRNPHLARIDPGQLVDAVGNFEIGYVPVVISSYHPEEYSRNGLGLETAPDTECYNEDWTDTYHPDI